MNQGCGESPNKQAPCIMPDLAHDPDAAPAFAQALNLGDGGLIYNFSRPA